jgi:hypothetical protein
VTTMSAGVAPRCVGWRRQLRLLGRHVRTVGRERAARRRELVELFHGVNAWLREVGVVHWLAYGTLLGWHRERALLAHDVDVDFGATVAGYETLRRAGGRLPRGFTLRDSSHRHLGPKLYVTFRGREADIYFYEEREGQLRPLLRSREPGDAIPLPRAWIEPREAVAFLGATTYVPAEPVKCLETFYGYIGPDAVRDPATRYFRPRQPGAADARNRASSS